MQTSPEVKNLTAALVKAQAAFPDIPKDKEVQAGPRKYRYADLATIIGLTRKPLAEAGLAVTMGTEMKDDAFLLTCRISHSTGEWMEAQYPMPKDQGSQVIGAAMTYGRRYLLSALLNICADDDTDGEEAKDVPHGKGNGKPPAATGGSFTTDPRQAAKEAKKAEKKADVVDQNAGLASVTIKSIQAGEMGGVQFCKLMTSGGDFLIPQNLDGWQKLTKIAQEATQSKGLVVIDFKTTPKGNNVVTSLRMEG